MAVSKYNTGFFSNQGKVALMIQSGHIFNLPEISSMSTLSAKKGKRQFQVVPQSQTAALPRPQEEEETDKSKQAQTEQTYEKH